MFGSNETREENMSLHARNFGLRSAAIAIVSACLAAATLPAQAQETIKLLMPWNISSAGNMAVANRLMELVTEETGVTVQRFDNGVVPPFEQLEPVMSGVFDIHYTNASYHAGDTVVGQLLDTVVTNSARRRESGIWDMIDKAYQKRNLKLLSVAPSVGYQFLLRSDLPADGTLNGMKIRSNPAYDGTIRALGGAPIQLPVTEVYSSLEKGLIDGTAFPRHGVVSAKLGEVIKYQVRPSFGQGTDVVLMNLDKWNSLTPEMQEKFLKAGQRLEGDSYKIGADIAEADDAALAKDGITIKQLGETAAANVNLYYNQGIWDRAAQNGGEEAAAIIKFIKDNDLVFNGYE